MPLAIFTGRYAFTGKKWLTGFILVPMIMPPFVGAIGMRQILARNGTVDLLVVKVLSFFHLVQPGTMGVVDIMSAGLIGVIILETLHLYPIMYLNVAAALANVDPALEESARNMGASSWRLFRTVTMPLTMPGFFAGAIIVFVWAFTDLGTPLMFNFTSTIPVRIFDNAKAVEQNVAAFALVVLVIAVCALAFLASKWFSGRRTYYMLSKNTRGKAEIPLGWKGTTLAYAAFGFITLIAVLPHLSVVLTSVSGKWFMTMLPTEYTLRFYKDIFTKPDTLSGIKNSLFYSAGSTAFDIAIGVGLAYILARKKVVGKGALDMVAMMPLALPGFVLAFGYVAVFVGSRSMPFLDPFINPTLLLMVSYSVRRLPFMVRSVYAGFQQVSPESRGGVGQPRCHARPHPPEGHHPARIRQYPRRRHPLLQFCDAGGLGQPDSRDREAILPHFEAYLQPLARYTGRRQPRRRHGRPGHGSAGCEPRNRRKGARREDGRAFPRLRGGLRATCG